MESHKSGLCTLDSFQIDGNITFLLQTQILPPDLDILRQILLKRRDLLAIKMPTAPSGALTER
jgi:hypothetical protein